MRLRLTLPALLVAACANSAMQPQVNAVHPATALAGTILSVHTIPAAGQAALWRLLDTGAAPDSATAAPLAEFIVREDDGTTVSIVQDNALGLRAGDRVSVVRGERAHLVRG